MMTVETKAQIEATNHEPCIIVGIYRQYDARKKQTKPPLLRGHAWLVLADDTHVYIEPPWRAAAIRPDDERARCTEQRVAVHGRIATRMPSPDQPMAHPTGCCITHVTAIELVVAD